MYNIQRNILNKSVYKVIRDHIGSVRLVVNATNGKIVLSKDYDEFGRIINQSGAEAWEDFEFSFAGGLYDTDTKLIRFGARDYDPTTGRWTAKDPIGFDGGVSNLYEYCVNDPVNYVDLNGLQKVPLAPKGVNLENNIKIAEKHRLTPLWTNFTFHPISRLSNLYNLYQLLWFKKLVQNKGAWDYKQTKEPCSEEFGNFNYGATGAAMGIPDEILLRAAGYAQIKAKTSEAKWGNPFYEAPYGDDPKDQEWIKRGINYYKNSRGNK